MTTSKLYRRKHAVDVISTLRVVGAMCAMESLVLCVCVIVALSYHDGSELPFLYTTLIMGGVGALLLFLTKNRKRKVQGYREGALTVVLTWVALSVIGMLPFLFGGYTDKPLDALFETVSGFTTTGATTFADVQSLPPTILLWRALTQWQGGVGIVVFTMALAPMFSSGEGGALYNAETTGIKHDRFLPRIRAVAQRVSLIYLGLTIVLILLLYLGPMNLLDAICYAFSCISTGGFSVHNDSVAVYNSPYVESVLSLFMFIGSLNLSLVYLCCIGAPKKLFGDEEFRWFTAQMLIYIFITALFLFLQHQYDTLGTTIRKSIFQVVSMASTTGFLTSDINAWGSFFVALCVPMMFVCGCAGSTSGGLKMSRFMVMIKNLQNEFKKRIHPNMVANVRFNGRSVDSDVVMQVLAFISLYLCIIVVATIGMALCNNDFTTSVTSVISCISNVGPCIGEYTMHYANASAMEKFILSVVMLAGRLEVFTFIGIMHPFFWKK